jgi:glycosidase
VPFPCFILSARPAHSRWVVGVAALLILLGPLAVQAFTTLPSRADDEPGFVYTASPEDWREVPIYQVITDRFYDGDPANNDDNPDGTYDPAGLRSIHGGDFEGLEAKLDYIQMLGARAIWISPVVRNANGEFHGFAATDFNAIDPHWGTLDDLRSLVDAAHARGMYVIIDVVQNHTGDRIGSYDPGFPSFNPGGYSPVWWNSSRRHAPPFDDLDRFYNLGQINNWNDPVQSLKGDFFSLDAINTELPAVRQDMITIYNALIAATDCDGFRVDTAKHVEMDFWETFLPGVDSFTDSIGKSNFIVFAEAWYGSDSDLAPFTGPNRFNSALHFPLRDTMEGVFVWGNSTDNLTYRLNNLSLYDPLAREQLVQFLDNHDMARYLSGDKLNGNSALLRVALSFLYTSGRVPALYYGTEQAFNGGHDPYDREDMFDGEFEFGPSLGDNFDVTAPIFRHVRTLNLLRTRHPALVRGQWTPRFQTTSGRGLYVYSMELEGDEVVVALNTSDQLLTAESGGLGPQTSQTSGTVMANLLDPAETILVGQGGGPSRITFDVPSYGTKIWAPLSDVVALPPSITSLTPAHDSADVARGSKITLTFDQPMNMGSVEAAFSTVPSAPGSFVWTSATQCSFTPASPLSANTVYTVQLSGAAQSASGEALGTTFHASFTTGTTIIPLDLVDRREYLMDGSITGDEVGALRVSANGVDLYVDFNGEDLYFATQAAENGNDRFILVTTTTSGSSSAMWAKNGLVAGLQHYIGNEFDNGWSGWFHDAGGSGGFTASQPGGWLEGVLDPVSAFGSIPNQIFVASVPYETPNGGNLISPEQCPGGDGDINVESGEYYLLDLSAFDTDGDGLADLQEDANANGQVDAGETHPWVVDTDTDGMTDGEEAVAGTDPTNPQSVFVSQVKFVQSSEEVRVQWTGFSGHRYTVWAADLIDGQLGSWTLTAMQEVPGSGGLMEYVEPSSNGQPLRVFRVGVVRQ